MAPAPAAWAVLSDALWCLGLGCLLAAGRDTVRLALGEGPVRCFFCDVAAFAAAAVLVGRGQRRGTGPLVYERRNAAGGTLLAQGRAAHRAQGGLPADAAAAGTAALCA